MSEAGARVGPGGRAIGIDRTEEMIALASRNTIRGRDGQPVENVEFHLASIDDMPLPDALAGCLIGNCVINLAHDKQTVIGDARRILNQDGQLAVNVSP